MNKQLIFILLSFAALSRALQYNESLCTVCEEMVQEVQGAIQSEVSLELAGALMQDMCANSLEEVAPVCSFLVDGYLPSVMEITSTLAYELCPLLNLCQSYSPFQADEDAGKGVRLSECSLCQLGALESRHRKHPPLPPPPPPSLLSLVADHPKCGGDADGCARAISFFLSHLLSAGAWSPACDSLDSCGDRRSGQKLPMGSKYCIFCKVIVNQAQGSLASMSADTFQGLLENVCAGLDGSGFGRDDEDLQKECEELTNKYGDVMLQIVQKVSPASLCGMFNICSNSLELAEHTPDLTDSSVCFMCQTAFEYLTELLQDGDVDSNIVSLIEKVCYSLPSGVSSQCYNFVSTYGTFLLSKVASLLGSKAICNNIPGCYNQTEKWEIAAETKQLIRGVGVFQPEDLVRDNLEALTCSWCTYMVGQLVPVVLNQDGEYTKNKVFNNSCSLLPSNFHNVDCSSCRERYEATITALIKEGKRPYQICHQHIACCKMNASLGAKSASDEILSAYYWIGAEALAPFSSAPGHRHLLSKHKSKHPVPPPPPDQAQCMACEFLVASAFEEKPVHLPHAPGHDRRELKQACREVPKGYEEMCESSRKKMAKTHLHKYKLRHGSPPKACAAVGECKSKANGRLLSLPLASQNLLLYGMQDEINSCVLCKLVAGVISVQLKAANLTINLVEYMVQTVCNMMQRDECWEVVDSLKTIIRKVGQYVDPSDVCVNTGFCSGASLPLLGQGEPPYAPLDA